MPSFHVDSEVGVLQRVLLHRPGLELRRLTPSNCEELLFDDVLWVKRARQEHDVFADTLRERGVEVLYVTELLAETLKDDAARRWLLDLVIRDTDLGDAFASAVRDVLDAFDATTLATHLTGGLTVAELPPSAVRGLRAATLPPGGFVLPPLPNHLFARDTTCWIYNGVSLNPMASAARRREIVHKSDIGGVRLGIASPDDAARAYEEMQAAIGPAMTGALVEPMVDPGVEVIVGVVHDEPFGPLVMFGLGGTAAELMQDRSFRALPLTDLDVGELVRSLRTSPLLFGYRGAPPCNTGALEDLLLRVGRLAEEVPELAELDLNPVVVSPEGVVVVDARIRLTPVVPPPDVRRLRDSR